MMAGLICDVPLRDNPEKRTTAPFEVRMSEIGRGLLARVRGPLDLHYAPGFQQQLRRHLAAGKPVVVDLREADYVDSSGVRILLQLHKELDAAGGELRLVIAPKSRVERVIKLLQLQSHFHIFATSMEAAGKPGSTSRA
jgi:anti-sigma B factor antagonist